MRRVRIRDPGIEARVGAGETQTWNGDIRNKHVPHTLMSSHFDTINVHWNHILTPAEHLTVNYSFIIIAKLPFDTSSGVLFLYPDNNWLQEEGICLVTRYKITVEFRALWIIFYKYPLLCCNRSNCWLQHLKIISWHHLMVYSSKSFLLQFKSNLWVW